MTFGKWLANELQARNISQTQLAKQLHLSQSAISLFIADKRAPSPETLEAIAVILHLQKETVFRAAGILDPIPPDDQRVENWREILRLLTPEEEAELREIGLLKIKRREAASRIKLLKQPPGNDY